MKRAIALLALAPAVSAGAARPASGELRGEPQRGDDAAVRRAMQDELARSMKELRLGAEPRPYFVSYTVGDTRAATASATFGAPTNLARGRLRSLRVDLRVGSSAFDSGNADDGPSSGRGVPIPFEDDYLTLRRELWWRTDEVYKQAIEALSKKRAAARGQAASADDKVADFAAQPPATTVGPVPEAAPDPEALRDTVTRLSALFRGYPEIATSRADASWTVTRRRLLTSEGTWADEGRTAVTLAVEGETQADDGMPLRSFVTFTAIAPAALPTLVEMERAVRKMADELTAMRRAPVVENGSAAVLFEGAAAAQLVKLLVVPQLGGTPPPKTASDDGGGGAESEWSSKLGLKVAASSLGITDDPTVAQGPGRAPLLGGYRADEEGVPARAVSLVEAGILKSLLMTRVPRKEIAQSNGHARATPFGSPEAHIGNLIVAARGGLPHAALLDRLARSDRGAPAYVVRLLDDGSVPSSAPDDASGLRMMMGAGGAPSVKPLVVYRLRAGKEELVRGLTLEGLAPRSLKDVSATGRDPVVWSFLDPPTGVMGIPSSIVTPPLLVSDVDVKKDTRKNRRPPLYPHPAFASRRN